MSKQQKDQRREAQRILDLMSKYQVPLPAELVQSPRAAELRMPFAEIAAMMIAPIDKERSAPALRDGARAVHEHFNTLLEKLPTHVRFEGEERPLELACTTGCNHCCTFRVTLKAPEALLIANYIRKKFTPEEVDALLTRIAEFEKASEGLSLLEQGYRSMMCPLNVDSLCKVYTHRPLNCSAYHSFRLQACIDDREDPSGAVPVPTDAYRRMLHTLHGQAMECALVALGLEADDLEFIPALRIALTDPEAGEKYLRGEPVFAEANRPDLREAVNKDYEERQLTRLRMAN